MEDHSNDHQHANAVDMPAPSFWPMVLAFGITLLFAGLVTHYIVSIVGAIIGLRAAVSWWHEVIPRELHEHVPVRHPAEWAVPVQVSTRSVAKLKAGVRHHRMRVPEKVHPYTAGIWGGLAGGAAMAILACLYGWIAQGSIWYPVNLLAAVVIPSLGEAGIEQLRAFNGLAFAAALVGHGIISILVGVLYAVTLPMFPRRAPIWAGLIVPLFWTGLVAATLQFTNPALDARINWIWFVICQIAFGLVAGFVAAKTQRIDTMQNWSFIDRAAFEAQFRSEDDTKG